MAEAFQINNDTEKAINNYKKALELDAENKKIKKNSCFGKRDSKIIYAKIIPMWGMSSSK